MRIWVKVNQAWQFPGAEHHQIYVVVAYFWCMMCTYVYSKIYSCVCVCAVSKKKYLTCNHMRILEFTPEWSKCTYLHIYTYASLATYCQGTLAHVAN